jgi:hypothetical protein
MAVIEDPVLSALEAAENGDIDLNLPTHIGHHDLEEPAEQNPDLPPSDTGLSSGAGVAMSDDPHPDEEPVEEEIPEVPEEEPEPVPHDGAEGEEPARPPGDSPSVGLLDEAYEAAFGQKPDVDTSAALLGLARDLSSASPDRVARARAILAGLDVQSDGPVEAAGPVAVHPVAVPQFEETAIPEYVDDDTRAVLESQNAKIRQLTEWAGAQTEQAQQSAVEFHRQQQQVDMEAQVSAAEAAKARFVTDHPGISDADLVVLQDAASRNPLYGTFVQQYGDYEKAAYATFRHTLVDLPKVYESVIAAQTAAEADRRKTDTTRKEKASAVSGAAAAPPRPNGPLSKADREAQLMEELRSGALG